MTARPPRLPANRSARRGVTLVEMLVTVGLLVLVMTILVQIFQSATGALSAQRAYAGLDQDIRRADTFLRQDLSGTTARMTPPLNPAEGLGYFTYGENALADLQGEDTDDYLAFTAKAPPGRPFSGTMMVGSDQRNSGTGMPISYKRVPISSDFAEIVYFLRNGNLYRRVFLILPRELQGGVTPGLPLGAGVGWGYDSSYVSPATGLYGLPVGWQGLNDLSARPSAFSATASYAPHLNTLGDLTNRENRAFSPRFANDFINNGTGALVPDGIPDDQNGDGVPDWYPTMYPNLVNRVGTNWVVNQLIPPGHPGAAAFWNNCLAFPYVYPGAFSRPDPNTIATRRSHSLDPSVATPTGRPAFGTYLDPPYNHSPLDLDDPLGVPGAGQTWWGFPTKKETASPFWTDPVKRLNDPASMPMAALDPAYQQSASFRVNLPPMTDTVRGTGLGQLFAAMANPAGDTTPAGNGTFAPTTASPPLQPFEHFQALVEEDLILTGVRSFDIKAFDPSLEAYMDLGYMNMATGTPPTVDVNFDGSADYWTLRTFAHEGRMPPLTTDFRSDPQAPAQNPNVGDDDQNVVRMTRVWDTWSTAYTNTPLQIIGSAVSPMVKPALPSYPAPYPIPLRGIQINVRVVEPGNERMKQITIRQDFSSKL